MKVRSFVVLSTASALIALGVQSGSASARSAPMGSAGASAGRYAATAPRSAHVSPATKRAATIAAAQAAAGRTRVELRLPRSERLVVKDVITDGDGTRHVRYDRLYRGLPVVGGDLIVHRAPNGKIRGVDWGSRADLSTLGTIRPSVSARTAVFSASKTAGLSHAVGRPALAVWALGARPRLAWKAVMSGADAHGPAREAVYVSAANGLPLGHWSELQSSDAAGTGHSLYSGQVGIRTNDTSGTGLGPFTMRDLKRGKHYVVDMNDQDLGSGTLFTDPDNTWGDGTTGDRATVAVDAQYGAARTWDFYKNTFGRIGIRDDGVGSFSRVHFDDDSQVYPGQGPGFDNAFWDDSCFCMTYGDGQNVFKPLVSLDVAGHEMSHGVTSHTAGLLYFGESGGLNESTSDIFGTGVEFSAANAQDPGDYYIGEKIVAGAPHFLRRMDHPSLDGDSFDCWAPHIGRADVHFTSGVPNHFFYLLAQGSGATTIGGLPHDSPTCNGSAVTGIGRAKALQIWYRALTVYLTEGSNFRHARDATIRAARDLYGPTSTACATVAKAWSAVSVKPLLWTCRGGNTSTTAGQLLKNGGFESGPVSWSASAGVIIKESSSNPVARSGKWFAYLDGFGTPHTQSISQRVVLPKSRRLTLVYHLLVDSADSSATAHDTLRVQVKVGTAAYTTLATFDNTDWDDTYNRHTVNLSSYRGKTVRVRFLGVEDASLQTGFILDDLAIQQG